MSGWKARFAGAAVIAVGLCSAVCEGSASPVPSAREVVGNYANLAQAVYGDALVQAVILKKFTDEFLARPTQKALDTARAQWKAARVPYLQSEGFRFANATVDEWEPRVNAWPLDEGMIDYVAPAYGTQSDDNPLYTLNVIGRTHIRIGAKQLDATKIDATLLRSLQQAEGVQTNVSTGYHAIEFLLWGQPVRGQGPGVGQRPASDYDPSHCTHGNCARRAAYLKAASAMLVSDLSEMVADWRPGGKARAELLAKSPDGGLSEILTGLGSLSFGEMAGERMKLGLMLHDPQEAQDCFSDNTHNSHYYDEIGISNLWGGRYAASGGHVAAGASLRDFALAKEPASARQLDVAIAGTLVRIKLIKDTADSGRMGYDQMISAGNAAGNKLVEGAMDALVAQTRAIEAVAAGLKVQIASNKSDRTVARSNTLVLH